MNRRSRRSVLAWADVTPLTFTLVTSGNADIVMNFASGSHGDGGPFDGSGGVLAHAFFPSDGRAHFDEDETWTLETYSGINLYFVAVQEFGHNLGLGHSNIESAVMAPFYREYVPNLQLHEDDIAGIQAHYGEYSGGAFVTMEPSPTVCTGSLDAVTTSRDSSTYIFEGDQYYRFNGRVDQGYPRPLSVWNIPGNPVGAVVQWLNSRIYFFAPDGGYYYHFSDGTFRVDDGYPLDTATIWQGCNANLEAGTSNDGDDNGVSGLAPGLLALVAAMLLGITLP